MSKRLSSSERRAQIIVAAEDLFKTRPYSEFGVPEVARALGITQGLVYHYFPSKEALVVAAVEARARELLTFCLPEETLPLGEQIERGVAGYLDYVEAHNVAYLNLFRGATASEPDVLRICEETRTMIIGRLLSSLGLLAHAAPATRLSLRAYFGYSENAVLQWLDRRDIPRATLEKMLRSMMLAAVQAGLGNELPTSLKRGGAAS